MNLNRLDYYFHIFQNINNVYQMNRFAQNRFWLSADKDFLHDLYQVDSAYYAVVITRYIRLMIDQRMSIQTPDTHHDLCGKIWALTIGDQLSDGMAEGETGGFFDACDTPPPEFWITFENGVLYSFIPVEFFSMVDDGIAISIGESLQWVTDLIYFRKLFKTI